MPLTPRQRVMTALRGGVPDETPFTIYAGHLPRCTAERELRDRGLCLVERVASYKTHHPNVGYKSDRYTDERGRNMVRATYTTPHGDLSCVWEPAGFTDWRHEWLFKSPADYKALLFFVRDTVVEPDYDAVARLPGDLGEDFVVRDQLPLEPLQNLISSNYMSTETFGIEWMDNRDEVLKLYDAFVEVARRIYPIVANGPLEFCNYGGNVVPRVIGPSVFRDYYLPHYNEAADVLHAKGKLIGSHLDADNATIMDLVAQTRLDYIEAYDPGMGPSVAEARTAWPGKALWLNYPASWHLRDERGVYDGTVQMIREAAPGNGFIIGITEDVPEDRWRGNYKAIMDAIDGESRSRGVGRFLGRIVSLGQCIWAVGPHLPDSLHEADEFGRIGWPRETEEGASLLGKRNVARVACVDEEANREVLTTPLIGLEQSQHLEPVGLAAVLVEDKHVPPVPLGGLQGSFAREQDRHLIASVGKGSVNRFTHRLIRLHQPYRPERPGRLAQSEPSLLLVGHGADHLLSQSLPRTVEAALCCLCGQ